MTLTFQELAQALVDACGVVRPAPTAASAEPTATPPAASATVTPASPTEAVSTPVPKDPVQMVDYAAKGYHLDVTIEPAQVVSAAKVLDGQGFALDAVTGVDWLATGEMEVVYDYFHPGACSRIVIRARIPRGTPEIPTISEVFAGANWHERETHDFFGIRFLGHPNLTPLLLPEDADFHPLRKDFTA